MYCWTCQSFFYILCEQQLTLSIASQQERGAKGELDLPIELQVLEFSGLLTLLAINDAFLLLLLIEEH